MLRLIVVALLACNLLLFGVHVASESPGSDIPVASPAPLPPGVPELQLIDELAPGAFPEINPRQCYSAGPFETVPTMIAAREALGIGAEDIRERETEALVELGYWVSLPAVAGFAEAGESMRTLEAAGLQDIAIVSDDTGEYRVSLGYFLEEANARRRRNEVRELGFEAETRLQRETQTRFWLDYVFSEPDMARNAARALPAGQQREIDCGAVTERDQRMTGP